MRIDTDEETGRPLVRVSMFGGMGDSVMATGAMGALADKFPSVLFDVYVAQYPEVFWNLPFVRRVLYGHDGDARIIPLLCHTSPGDTEYGTLYTAYRGLNVLDVPTSERRLRFVHHGNDLEWARTELEERGWRPGEPTIGVQLTGGKRTKSWKHSMQFCRMLRNKGWQVVVTHTEPVDVREDRIIFMCDFYNARALASVQHYMSAYVGFDSGPSWLAAASGIPSLWLFSATDPDNLIRIGGANAPYGVIWPHWEAACLDAFGRSCRTEPGWDYRLEGSTCPFFYGGAGADCLNSVSPFLVYDQLLLLLEEAGKPKPENNLWKPVLSLAN